MRERAPKAFWDELLPLHRSLYTATKTQSDQRFHAKSHWLGYTLDVPADPKQPVTAYLQTIDWNGTRWPGDLHVDGDLYIRTHMLDEDQRAAIKSGESWLTDFPDNPVLWKRCSYQYWRVLGAGSLYVKSEMWRSDVTVDEMLGEVSTFKQRMQEELQQGLWDPSAEDYQLVLNELTNGVVNQAEARGADDE